MKCTDRVLRLEVTSKKNGMRKDLMDKSNWGKNVIVGNGVTIGDNVFIGHNCII